jgi:O-antigen ligase
MSSFAYACLWLFTFTVPWEATVMIPGLSSGPTGNGTIGKLVGLATAGVGLFAVLARGRARRLALFHVLAGCFVLWMGLGIGWSMDPGETKKNFTSVVQAAAIPWLIWEFAGTPMRRRRLLQAYVFGAYVSAISALLNWQAGISVRGSHGAVTTTMETGRYSVEGFNPNELGFLLVLALPLAWHLSLTHRNTILRWVNRLYLPIGTLAILLTGSRSSLIGVILALCIVPLTLGRLSPAMKVGVVAILIATVSVGAFFIPEKTLERLSTTKEEIESGTLNERRVIWRAGGEVFLRHPIRGVGSGAFPAAVEPFLGYSKTAHNTYLSVLVEEGAVGLILFTLMLVSIYLHVRSAAPDERRFVLVLLVTLLIGLIPRSWEVKKPLWLMFGFLLAPSAVAVLAHRPRPMAAGWRISDLSAVGSSATRSAIRR